MLKLNAGFSRKVGEPNYGSRGASVNVELELESNLIGDPEGLSNRIRQLFEIAQSSVEHELSNGNSSNHDASNAGNGHGQHGRGNNNIRYATASQVRAIRAICQSQNRIADRIASQKFGVNAVEDLTVQQASSLIDELKAAPAGRNGGGR